MFLEDAPLEELPATIKTLMKDVVDNALFKQVKFYQSPQELNHVMGYVFYRIGQMEEVCLINWNEQDCGQPGVTIFQPRHVN